MRLRSDPQIDEKLKAFPRLTANLDRAGDWPSYFGNEQPLCLEIGMGRGKFITALSERCPEYNFVAIDLRKELIYDAARKLGDDHPNVALILGNALELGGRFGAGEITRIYLNFSDPWPKKHHRKRRLTHESFLRVYRQLLIDGGEILFRTDNRPLYDYTLATMAASGFTLAETSTDFHNSPYFDGVTTEYEDKKSKTQPICYARFVKNGGV